MMISGTNLSIQDVHAVAVKRERVELDPEQLKLVIKSWERVQKWGNERHPMYGVNTGFGELAQAIIPPKFKKELQLNMLRSHATGGQAFPDEVVRAIMLSRLNCLMKGYSGASVDAVELFQEFLNSGIHPIVPQQGSLGASGDLGPLAHVAIALIGEGNVRVEGVLRPSCEVMKEYGLKPLPLGYKQALSLINGTSGMTGAACLALNRAQVLLRYAVLASAAFVQCLNGSTRAFEDRGHRLKNHSGQIAIAAALRELLQDSRLTQEHVELMRLISKSTDGKEDVLESGIFIQNAYTLRCIPQILGPVLDTLNFCCKTIEEELNSCNDNPLIFDTPQDSFHGGNFHGQYVSMACDFMNVSMTEIGVLVDRQLDRLLDPHLNGNLPPFLADGDPGLFCGFEGAQYLVTSIASENLDLASPTSIKSIPSNGSNQDVVSMGLNAARKSLRIADHVETMLVVMFAACYQASHFIGIERFSPPVKRIFTAFAEKVGRYKDDRLMYEVLEKIREVLASEETLSYAKLHINLLDPVPLRAPNITSA
jgi:tyrosine 2,3-aminomutase